MIDMCQSCYAGEPTLLQGPENQSPPHGVWFLHGFCVIGWRIVLHFSSSAPQDTFRVYTPSPQSAEHCNTQQDHMTTSLKVTATWQRWRDHITTMSGKCNTARMTWPHQDCCKTALTQPHHHSLLNSTHNMITWPQCVEQCKIYQGWYYYHHLSLWNSARDISDDITIITLFYGTLQDISGMILLSLP